MFDLFQFDAYLAMTYKLTTLFKEMTIQLQGISLKNATLMHALFTENGPSGQGALRVTKKEGELGKKLRINLEILSDHVGFKQH